jgi:xeroderma pigmentosum group C-complementing protein
VVGDGPTETSTRRRAMKGKEKGKAKASQAPRSAIPAVFQDLLAETLTSNDVAADTPRKRRKTRHITPNVETTTALPLTEQETGNHDEDDDESLEFEDVVPQKTLQTAYDDSGDSEEEVLEWNDAGPSRRPTLAGNAEDGGDLVLTLNAEADTNATPHRKSAVARRKAITKEDRILRLEIHKMNLLCLLRFVDKRNDWCNDKAVQDILKPLLSKRIIECLQPKENYSQFGKAESVKKGLTLLSEMWESKFIITARGMRRPYWAENENDLSNVCVYVTPLYLSS